MSRTPDERTLKQFRVFTEWVNYRLERGNHKPIKTLTHDLQDGTALYNLLGAISSKPVGKGFAAKPKNKMQAIGNLSLAMKFIASEKIRLENIGAEDIWDGTEVCVMGLIWTLILRYQISDGDSTDAEAKAALLEWVRQQVAPTGVPIENFTTTWADGRAFAALTSRFAPAVVFPDDLTGNAVNDMENAFRVNAEDLGVPHILSAADVAADPRGNEKSIMTYLAVFKEMVESRAVMVVEPERTALEPTKCVAYGPGLEAGKVARPAVFTIEARDVNGNRIFEGGDDCEIVITTASGRSVPSSMVDSGDGLYEITYAPNEPGDYTVAILMNGTQITETPFVVAIEPEFGKTDTSKSLAYGPGILGGKVGRATHFTIESVNGAGQRIPVGGDDWKVSITDPNGANIPATIVDNADGSYKVSYVPGGAGDYQIVASLLGAPLNGSPFTVEIRDLTLEEMEVKGLEPGRSVAHGWGLRSGGLCVQLGKFVVYARDNRGCRLFVGGAKCEVEITNPDSKPLSTPVSIVDNEDSTYSVVYRPEGPGWYTVSVKLNGGSVSKSPFRVLLHELNFAMLEAMGLIFEPTDASKSIAYGKGLQGKQALDRSGKLRDMTASFTVQSRDANGQNIIRGGDLCEIKIKGPDGRTFMGDVHDNFDGTYSVTYPVGAFGVYDIDVTLNGKPVGSTYRKEFYCYVNVGSVIATGSGLTEALVDESTTFSLETKDLDGVTTPISDDRLQVKIIRPNGEILPAEMSFNGDGTYDVTYEAREEGAHEIQVLVDGRPFGTYTSHVKLSNLDPFNMRKGDSIPITAGKISVGLGWSNAGKTEIDLDASCMMFRYTTKLDHCYFKDTRSLCGSVQHSGDKRSGSGATKDDETIRVNLDKVPGKYTTLLFTVNIWDADKTFEEITNAYVRLIDDTTNKELCRYSLSSFGAHTGLIMCSVYRTMPSQWHMRAIGEFGDGRTIGHINKAVIRPQLMTAPPPQLFSVRVLNARNLVPIDGAQNQVFVQLRYDNDSQKTRVATGVDATWNQALSMQGQGHVLEASVWHQRRGFGAEHAFLGRVSIPIVDGKPVPVRWYILNNRGREPDGKIHGKIRLGVEPIHVAPASQQAGAAAQ